MKYNTMIWNIREQVREELVNQNEDEALIHTLIQENKLLRELLKFNVTEEQMKRIEKKIEEEESEFFINFQFNPEPTEYEQKMAKKKPLSFNKGLEKTLQRETMVQGLDKLLNSGQFSVGQLSGIGGISDEYNFKG